MSRHRYEVVFGTAGLSALDAIELFVDEHGEGNVDKRDPALVKGLLASNGLFDARSPTGDLVAVGGVFPYAGGSFTELGMLVVKPEMRGTGLGSILLSLRIVLAALNEFDTKIVAEIYPTSFASRALWARHGGRQFEPAVVNIDHAALAGEGAVEHWTIPPSSMPYNAGRLLAAINGAPVQSAKGDLFCRFADNLMVSSYNYQNAIEELSCGNLSTIMTQSALRGFSDDRSRHLL